MLLVALRLRLLVNLDLYLKSVAPCCRRKAAGPAAEEAELFFVDDDPGDVAAPGRTGGSAGGTAAVAETAAATAVVPTTALREVTLLGGPGANASASAQVCSPTACFWIGILSRQGHLIQDPRHVCGNVPHPSRAEEHGVCAGA